MLWHEDDPGDTLHLIETGRVAVRIGDFPGSAATVAVLGPGEVVGELAVLGDSVRRAATVTALEPTETLSLDRARVRRVIQDHPEVAGFLIGLVVAHLQQADARLLEALFVPVERRVLLRLLDLCGGDATADVRLTQADLASVAGTSRATVNRVLRQLEESGAVELTRGRIRVLDRRQIAARVG